MIVNGIRVRIVLLGVLSLLVCPWVTHAYASGGIDDQYIENYSRELDAKVAAAKQSEIARVEKAIVDNRHPASLAAGERSIKELMKDPSSVQFRRLKQKKMDQSQFVCGEFNAKNSYGGYVGFKRFIANAGGVIAFDGDDTGPFAWALAEAGMGSYLGSTPNPAITQFCES